MDPRDMTVAELNTLFANEERELRILNALKGLNPEDKPMYLERFGLPTTRQGERPAGDGEPAAPPTLTLDEMTKLPPVEWLIPGYIPRSGLTQLSAASGSGKSFLALDWATQLVREGRRVLYVAAEGFQGMGGRVRAWRYANPEAEVDSDRFVWLHPNYVPDLTNPVDVDAFIDRVLYADNPNGAKYDLIVFDTLARVMTGSENDAEVVGAAVKACAQVSAELGGAVLLVHHFGWDGNRQRGSSALYGACDAVIYMESVTDSSKTSKVYVSKMKDGESGPEFYVQVHAPDPLNPNEATMRRVDAPQSDEAILAALSEHGPITAENFKSHVGMGREKLAARLEALNLQGLVSFAKGPKNGTYWSVRDDADEQ